MMACLIDFVTIRSSMNQLRTLVRSTLGINYALSLNRVINWPQIAVCSLFNNSLIYKIGELSFHLSCVDPLLLLLSQLLLHLRKLCKFGLGIPLLLLLCSLIIPNLSLSTSPLTTGFHHVPRNTF